MLRANCRSTASHGRIISEKPTKWRLQPRSGYRRQRRGVPCFAFRDGFGKLDRLCCCLIAQGGDRTRRAALFDHIAGAAFAATALQSNTQFKLDFIKRHACMRMACNLSIRDPTANTNDHGAMNSVVAG